MKNSWSEKAQGEISQEDKELTNTQATKNESNRLPIDKSEFNHMHCDTQECFERYTSVKLKHDLKLDKSVLKETLPPNLSKTLS